uniref:Apolipophorin n=1 Tax=Anoplophora glabripennis TaxID=217634 RepID=V5GSP6_ANOGL
MITLTSTSGATVVCTPDLVGCTVSISGFYHAQIKGLLGNGNNEPYDDFTIPNGKIVAAEGEFANSYKIGNCAPVNVIPHDQHQENPVCTKLFGWESPLRYCYPFVPTENFKVACAHGLAAGVKDTEVAIAKAYVALCNHRNIPIRVPAELVKCTNSDKSFSVGDKFSVKVPAKAADVVLIVDTEKQNENVYTTLVQPLVQEINKELHTKGINDVEIHLIAYGGENQWPTHVTVGGKLTFKGKAPNMKFSEAPKSKPLPPVLGISPEYLQIVDGIIHDLHLAFGQNLQARTYSEAISYPFRVHAVKSIIVINSRPCEVGKFSLLQKLRTLLFRNSQISLNLFTPLEGFSVKDVKKSKDVVGFNDENVFTVSQAKKKPEGTAELYKDLQYDDYCADFTIKNRGNVFVVDNFLAGKPDIKKQFTHIASHNIVDQLVNIEEGLDCECQLVNPYSAENFCHEIYSKERPTRKGASKG